jgi:hypothetical protein
MLLPVLISLALQAPPDPVDAPPAPDPIAALELGAIVDRAQAGQTLYLALARGGVAVIDLSDPAGPRLVRTIAEGRAITKLLIDGDRLHLIALREELLSFSVTDPRAPVASLTTPVGPGAAPGVVRRPLPAEPEPTPTPTVARARVLEVTGGRVIFDGGADAGFEVGQRVRIIAQRLVAKPDLEKGGFRMVASGDVTAVVAIEELGETRAMAVLGRGDVAMPSDVVEATDEDLSERLFLPPRGPYATRFGFIARPFLGLNNEGRKPVGVLVDLYGTYYLDFIPISVTAEIAPAGFVLGGANAHYPITVQGLGAYYTDWFEIGVGVGALVGNEGPCFSRGPGGAPECEVNNGLTINQMLRLGPIDGIHVTWNSSVFSRPDGFVFGVGRGELGVPLSSQLSLFGSGGAGENGWGYGELGVRTFVGGNGAPGTLVLTASLGVVGIFDGPGEEIAFGEIRQEFVVGPSVAFGVEWRL